MQAEISIEYVPTNQNALFSVTYQEFSQCIHTHIYYNLIRPDVEENNILSLVKLLLYTVYTALYHTIQALGYTTRVIYQLSLFDPDPK